MTTAALPLPNGEECQAPQTLTAIQNEKKFHECYELSKEILGNGSFSTVYSAKSMSPRRRQWSFSDRYDLAIKCIAKEKLDHDDILSIFNEVALLQTLHHPNIIRLENFFEENHFFYIVMERLVGGDLFDRLISKECYYEFEAKKVAKNLLDAVAFMHKRGVVHRDLKPENLLLVTKKDDYNVKIADFGTFSIIVSMSLSLIGHLLGTLLIQGFRFLLFLIRQKALPNLVMIVVMTVWEIYEHK